MIGKPATRMAAVLLAALCLNGCVAAAIPALAGTVMVRSQTDGEGAGDQENSNVAAPAPASVIAEQEFAPAPAAPTIPADSVSARQVIVGPAPAPTEPQGLSASVRAPLHSAFAQLIRFAGEKVSSTDLASLPQSAILKDPTALNTERAECLANLPTVLIDLDAQDEDTPSLSPLAFPALGEGLQSLRDQGISIAWISERSAAEAGDISFALQQSGLDPERKDTLLLMRYPGDRKQTRREDLAKSSCIIAIAGDNREDFDELFEYLVNPEAALGLELMLGDGWFLVPSVLAKEM